MSALERGYYRLFTGDDGEIELAEDAVSASEIVVPSWVWGNVYVGMYVRVKSVVAGSALSNLKVAQVYEMNGTTKHVRVEPPLPAALLATDVLQFGLVKWLKTPTSVVYRKPEYSTPVQDLLDANAVHEVVLVHGERNTIPVFGETYESVWEHRLLARKSSYAEAAAWRLRRLINGRSAEVQYNANGVVLGGLHASIEEGQREDTFKEWIVRSTCEVTPKAAL